MALDVSIDVHSTSERREGEQKLIIRYCELSRIKSMIHDYMNNYVSKSKITLDGISFELYSHMYNLYIIICIKMIRLSDSLIAFLQINVVGLINKGITL